MFIAIGGTVFVMGALTTGGSEIERCVLVIGGLILIAVEVTGWRIERAIRAASRL